MELPGVSDRKSDVFVIGVSGSPRVLHDVSEEWPNSVLSDDMGHDSAAVLLHNGEVIFGIEDERLSRIKHSNRFPSLALRACLDRYRAESSAGSELHLACYTKPKDPAIRNSVIGLLQNRMADLGQRLGPEAIHLVDHHYCHAASAYLLSPFDESLVVTIDGQGDGLCATVYVGEGSTLRLVQEIRADEHSIGWLYREVTLYLGFGSHDEYKIMGLAPYGDPARFRGEFRDLYELRPGGDWIVRLRGLEASLKDLLGPARHKNDPLTQRHKDIAAALQECVEAIFLHTLSHYRDVHRQKRLCLAGGVALNCKANGLVRKKRLFEEIFVQPASHDGGAALGAALAAENALGRRRPAPMSHLYWGTDVGREDAVRELSRWQAFVSHEQCPDIYGKAAALIAGGKVLGWVGGRSEFGPRALGNRSILADPRPASHKDRINAMVKKREAYRPFAPAVIEEEAHHFFDIDPQAKFPWMTVTADVRPEKRATLGAVTHVDGSARLQTVSRTDNPRFWRLLGAFKALTGVPILLNTSFNNNAEPIVDSAFDALVCLLTTGLDYLVIDDYLVRKKNITADMVGTLVASVPSYVQLNEATQYDPAGKLRTYRAACNRYTGGGQVPFTEPTLHAFRQADGKKSLAELFGPALEQAFPEVLELWSARLITLRPSPES